MKLILHNFKCWQEKTIDLGDSGITFLNGPSGIGKSSIFDAINFVITGDGKNLVSYGNNSLKVELISKNHHIIRTKRPNRLIFKIDDKEYEDDNAQEYINKYYSKLFPLISYINQNDSDSFLKMSPSEKLDFLESLAFKNISISEKKDNIKNIIKERTLVLNSISSKFESIKEILNNIKPVENPIFPVKCNDGQEVEIIEKYKKLSISKPQKLEKINTEIISNDKKLNDIKNTEEKIIILKNELDNLNSNICKLKVDLLKFNYSSNEYNELEQKIKSLDITKKHTEKLHKLFEDKNKLNLSKENILKKLTIQDISFPQETEEETLSILNDLSEYLNDIITIENINSKLVKQKEILTNNKKNRCDYSVEYLENKVNELQKKHELYKLSKVLLSCPSCKCKLSLINNNLIEYTKDIVDIDPSQELKETCKLLEETRKIDDNINLLCQKITEYENTIKEITEKYESLQTKDEIQDTKNEYEIYLKNNKKLRYNYQLEIETNTNILKTIEKDICNIEEQEKYYNSLILNEYNETEHNNLKEKLSEINYIKKNYENQNETLQSFEIRHSQLIEQLNKYNQILESKDDIFENIESLNIQKQKLEDEIKKICVINEKIAEYVNNKKEYDNWNIIYNKYKILESEETEAKNTLNSINLLKEKFLIAESIYLNTFIKKLSDNVQSYINLFFIEEPLTINIKPFKNSKKDSKPQINIDIGYKGMECDITTLSGGERDRLNLAFVLSFSEIMESPILLLDECISSLDYINFNNVLTALKEHYKGEMILLISHQANEGIFDKIINLK